MFLLHSSPCLAALSSGHWLPFSRHSLREFRFSSPIPETDPAIFFPSQVYVLLRILVSLTSSLFPLPLFRCGNNFPSASARNSVLWIDFPRQALLLHTRDEHYVVSLIHGIPFTGEKAAAIASSVPTISLKFTADIEICTDFEHMQRSFTCGRTDLSCSHHHYREDGCNLVVVLKFTIYMSLKRRIYTFIRPHHLESQQINKQKAPPQQHHWLS